MAFPKEIRSARTVTGIKSNKQTYQAIKYSRLPCRQSLVERFSVRDDRPQAMIRPAATVYSGLGIVSALDISSSMTD